MEEMTPRELQLEQIKSGVELIKKINKSIKKPASGASLKELKTSVALLEKKYKMLKKDENLAIQYMDRTAFDTVQGVFQAFHLYIISVDSDELVYETLEWLREHENCYDIADRMKAAANARADFNGVPKKV